MTADREAALKWQASMTAQQVNDKREAIIAQLEAAGQEMWCNGTCKAWLETAPDSVKEISKTVNGNMLRDLGNAVIHHDVFSADLFRTGATAGVCVWVCVSSALMYNLLLGGQLYGQMPVSGIGVLKEYVEVGSEESLRQSHCVLLNGGQR